MFHTCYLYYYLIQKRHQRLGRHPVLASCAPSLLQYSMTRKILALSKQTFLSSLFYNKKDCNDDKPSQRLILTVPQLLMSIFGFFFRFLSFTLCNCGVNRNITASQINQLHVDQDKSSTHTNTTSKPDKDSAH